MLRALCRAVRVRGERHDEIGLEHSHFPESSGCVVRERHIGLYPMCEQRQGHSGRDLITGIRLTWGSVSMPSSTSYTILSKLLDLLSFSFLIGKF